MAKLRWGVFGISMTMMLAGGRARAQEGAPGFGARGQVAVSAERMFGFVHAETTESQGGMDRTTTVNAISLVGNTVSLATVLATPHLAVDFFAANRLSLGGSFTYFHTSESESLPAGQTALNPTLSGFSVAPRIGYAVPLGPSVSFWPRIGFTLLHLSEDFGGTTTDSTIYAGTIEAPFVFTLVPSFFLSVAPTLDLGLGGSTSQSGGIAAAPNPSTSEKETDFGVLCGLGGFF